MGDSFLMKASVGPGSREPQEPGSLQGPPSGLWVVVTRPSSTNSVPERCPHVWLGGASGRFYERWDQAPRETHEGASPALTPEPVGLQKGLPGESRGHSLAKGPCAELGV